jgi:hypothetical protein
MRKLLAAIALMVAGTAAAQEPPLLRDRKPEARPTLLIVASAHFANPGRDHNNIAIEDITTPTRQREIEQVVGQLAAFRPTHVAIERSADQQATMDQRYADYRAGKYALNSSEHEQLGLRLAAKLNLPRVDAVDWNDMPPGDAAHYDWYAWGRMNGFSRRIEMLGDTSKFPIGPIGKRSVGEWLLAINRPETLAALHQSYFDIARIGADKNQPGAAWVGTWYARNLRIFNNLVSLASRPDDRVVVIYGAGHAYLLRQMARESGAFRVVDADQVLGPR